VAVNEGHATAVYGGLPSARRAIDHVFGLLRFVSVIEGSLRRNPYAPHEEDGHAEGA
jgi:hypothetical protein